MDISDQDNHIEVLNAASNAQNASLISRAWRVLRRPKLIPQIIKRRLFFAEKIIDWDSRVHELGAYSVIDSRHSPDEYEYVTKRQKEILYPYFLSSLNGDEKSVLDFGCGAGRFTADLADMLSGEAVGTDVTLKLIEMCPAHKNVTYIHSKNFFESNILKFDVIWVSLVLGGVPDEELSVLAHKIEKALKDNGLLFLVESTGEHSMGGFWRIRTRRQLMSLFPSIHLTHLASYYDANQEISVLAGRK